MTPRFRIALVLLAGVGAVTLALWLALGNPAGSRGGSSDDSIERTAGRGGGESALGVAPTERSPEMTGTAPAPVAVGSSGSVRRTPSGIDLSDPAQARALLAEYLKESVVPWDKVAELLRVMKEPLDPAARKVLLEALRTGNRAGARIAFESLNDGTLVPDLLAILDEPGLPQGARQAVLGALYSMPGADPAEVVRNLESRLTGDVGVDRDFLHAIASRGGVEAARALVEYVQRSTSPRQIPSHLWLPLALSKEPEAMAILSRAIAEARSPDTLRTLVAMAGQPGAGGVAAALIALDRDDQPMAVRQDVFASLGRIGTRDAVDHLLRVAEQRGEYGEMAWNAVAQIGAADADARARLLEAIDRAPLNPRPDMALRNLLRAAGTLRMEEAKPKMVRALDHADEEIRAVAVTSLGALGPKSRDQVGTLVRMYSVSPGPGLRTSIVIALGTIGGKEAADALHQMLGDTTLPANLARTIRYAERQATESVVGPPAGDGAGDGGSGGPALAPGGTPR
jgi:HEAT repeat protein